MQSLAIQALAGRGDIESLELIEELLDNPSINMRLSAAQALKGYKNLASLKLLKKALNDKEAEVSNAAIEVLKGRTDAAAQKLKETFLANQQQISGRTKYEFFRSINSKSCAKFFQLF